MFTSRPVPSPLTPVAPLGPVPLNGSIDGVQTSGPDLPIITNVNGLPVLGGNLRTVSAARVVLAAIANGGLSLPRYATNALASITSPVKGLLVWDDTLNVVKVYNGTLFVALTPTINAADIGDAGTTGVDLVQSETSADARVALGAGTTGEEVFLAATPADARTALGAGVVNTVLVPLCASVSTVLEAPTILAQVRFDPSAYTTAPTTISLEGVGTCIAGVNGTLELYDVDTGTPVANLVWTETSATAKSASVSVPGTAIVYGLRWSKSGGSGTDYALLGSAQLRLGWS